MKNVYVLLLCFVVGACETYNFDIKDNNIELDHNGLSVSETGQPKPDDANVLDDLNGIRHTRPN